MNSKLLNYVDDLVKDRLTLLEERKIDSSWINEDEDLKASTEEEIKLCNEVSKQIDIELFDHYIFSLKSHTIGMNKKYKDKEDFKKDYLKGEYFYDKDSYENGNYISKKELDEDNVQLIKIFDDSIGCLNFDTRKLKFIKMGDI
jgi:hypothetical protein|tara:strand:+ start:146 stop:577 length:432 start_codon:yes stop_codon:yes gene_type:complete